MAPVFLTFAFDLLVVLDFSAGSVADVVVVVDADGSPSSFHSLACFSSRRLSCKEIGIRGIQIGSNINGKNLNETSYEKLKNADKRQSAIFFSKN